MGTWRDSFSPIIARVIDQFGTDDMSRLRKELRKAFPSPPRQYHPYKIWLDEIRVQLGLKIKKHKLSKAEKNTKSLFGGK